MESVELGLVVYNSQDANQSTDPTAPEVDAASDYSASRSRTGPRRETMTKPGQTRPTVPPSISDKTAPVPSPSAYETGTVARDIIPNSRSWRRWGGGGARRRRRGVGRLGARVVTRGVLDSEKGLSAGC